MHIIEDVKTDGKYTIIAYFRDGEIVSYDLKPILAAIPAFGILEKDEKYFESVQVNETGDIIFWDENLNLNAEIIWENGTLVGLSKRPDIKRAIAYQLQLARWHANMTQKQLAEKTGVYQADISKLERGLGNPSINTLRRLAEGMGMELHLEFRYPEGEQEAKQREEERRMSKLASRPNYGYVIKPGMTKAFVEHLKANKKPDNYWEECANACGAISEDAMEYLTKKARGEVRPDVEKNMNIDIEKHEKTAAEKKLRMKLQEAEEAVKDGEGWLSLEELKTVLEG